MSASHPYRVVPGPIGARRGPTVPRRVLVVAVEAVVPEGLARADVVVVAPALNSRLRRWVSDEDAARRRAHERLGALVDRLRPIAGRVEGRVGDADPLLAIGDVLATFPADEIVVAAGAEYSTDRALDLVARAREQFALPVLRAGEPKAIAA
jgi:hypothetical protein